MAAGEGRGAVSTLGPLLLLLLLALAVLASCSDRPEPRRNLILISMDTLRADRLGAYGYLRPTSPNIDALAARGARFARAYSSAPWTLPAHATIFTGLTPQRHDTHGWLQKLPETVPTLAELLQQAGWRTYAHTTGGFVGGRYGFARGFEEYIDELGGFKMTLAAARRQIESWPRDEPYFLFLQTFTVHCPYPASRAHREAFRTQSGLDDVGAPPNCLVKPLKSDFSEAEKIFLSDRYDAAIRTADDKLAEFIRFLDERGEFEDTYLVLLSDHGDEFGEHGSIFHGHTLYEELLHVPLVIVGPGVEPGVVEERVGLVDLMPTVLDLLGVEKTGGEGRSLVGHLLGEFSGAEPSGETPYFASTDEGVKLRGVISGNYKLVLDLETDRVRLFDLEKDPAERHDLADQEPAARDRLRLLLDRHLGRASLGGGQEAALSEEEIEELRALGYAR